MSKKRVFAIDAETDPFDGTTDIQPYLWDIFDGQDHTTIETVAECHAFFKANPGLYYAHNGGRFDYHLGGFCDPIESGSEVLAISGRLVRFKMLGCEFRDSFAILPSPLKALGSGSTHKKEIDYTKMNRKSRGAWMHEIREYIRADTETLWNAVMAFRGTYGTGLTLAGAAFAQLKLGKKFETLSAGKDKIPRTYYFGGRVEAFFKGEIKKKFQVYDIASAYPRAMIEEHPAGTAIDIDCPKASAPIVDQAFYTVTGMSRGALPFIDEKKSLTFPNDEVVRSYRCTGWELRAGIETKTFDIVKITARVRFGKTQNFSAFVNKFYKLKADAPKGSHDRLFAKLILNGAYGKTGANPLNYSRQLVVSEEDKGGYLLEGWRDGGTLGKNCFVDRDLFGDELKFIHVGVAASITGWVRAYLWRAICEVRANGGKVLYCDTDSIFAQDYTIKTGEKLGDWTLDAQCVSGGIAGKKLYAIRQTSGEWKTSCKGARLNAFEIMRVVHGKTIEWKNNAPTYSISRGVRMMKRKIRKT
jgi:DNA polymerase type B, organellar and viral